MASVKTNTLKWIPALLVAALWLSSCSDAVNNTRLPNYPVYLNLSGAGVWNTYGVGGVGMHREFIKDKNLPGGFPYLASSYTGYGGILLAGVDAASNFADETWPYLPVAYDMSCPVEAERDVVVYVDDNTFEAVCPKCQSHYTLMSGGGPIAGPAVGLRYGLEPYKCIGSPMTGFIITRR